MTRDLDSLRERLEALGEELADAALEVLREAAEAGRTDRPELEKRLTQARRAVEKAAHLVAGADGGQ